MSVFYPKHTVSTNGVPFHHSSVSGIPSASSFSSIDTRRSRRWRLFLPGVPGNFVHSVVPIRLSISCNAGRQPNETHEKQRNGKQMRMLLEHVAFQVFKNVSLMAA